MTPMQLTDHRPRVAAERRERMRARLLASALRLVADKGPTMVTIDDVIQHAEVSRGTFYKYFPSPQVLVETLAIEVANELIRMAESVVVLRSDPAERVACGLRMVARLAHRHPSLAGFIVRIGWIEPLRNKVLTEYLERDLAAGVRMGRFKSMPRLLALNVVSSAVVGATYAMLQPGCEPDFVEQAAAAALRGLGLRDAEAKRIAFLPFDAIGQLQVTWLDGSSFSKPT